MNRCLFLLPLIALWNLIGCHTPTQPIEPTIQANWTEPVNGVRMAVTQIAGNTPDDHVLLLVMVQNVTDQDIEWPGIRAEPAVHLRQPDGSDSPAGYGSFANLRVVVEPLDRRGQHVIQHDALDEVMDRHRMLEPGETRLHAIRLEDVTSQRMQRQQQRDVINAESVLWPGLTSHDSEGRWRVRLFYRPEGFPKPPSDGRLIDRAELELDEKWEGVEIEPPAIEIDWVPIPGPDDL